MIGFLHATFSAEIDREIPPLPCREREVTLPAPHEIMKRAFNRIPDRRFSVSLMASSQEKPRQGLFLDGPRLLDLLKQIVIPLTLDIYVCSGALQNRVDQIVIQVNVEPRLLEGIECGASRTASRTL